MSELLVSPDVSPPSDLRVLVDPEKGLKLRHALIVLNGQSTVDRGWEAQVRSPLEEAEH